jgi:uncharacterized OsmC-like protein
VGGDKGMGVGKAPPEDRQPVVRAAVRISAEQGGEQDGTGKDDHRVYFTIEADLSEAEKEELVRLAHQHSPVAATISQATPVSVHLDKQ